SSNSATTLAIEIAIRLGVIFLILACCLQILTPFIGLIAWGAIIAVAIYKPFQKLVEKLGGRKKLAVTLIAVGSIAAILIPVISLSTSTMESATSISNQIDAGTLKIAPPSESVREWPLIGEKTYSIWHQASVDLSALLDKYPEHVATAGQKILGAAKGAGAGIFQFIISMLIAVAFLSSAESLGASMHKVFTRLAGEQGGSLLNLSTATIRSVAVGVIGIAFIQAVLGGLGMLFAGVPMAGLLAIIILVLAIAQLPPIIVLLPVIFYVFSVESTTVSVIFMIWSILVSMSDAVLKPIFLGRGVDAPMLVILLGAIGGMITSGIVGLFIGAIILALGYTLFQAWVEMGDPVSEQSGSQTAET
ncbi:MAG: AI-2E family transporter, partial [Xanthomonadales bacterium]|nr:AI-2E family transporter [Xanthomonadales bacterium]